MVRGGPEARFHEGSTRLPPGFHEVLQGLGVVRALKRAPHVVGDITQAYLLFSSLLTPVFVLKRGILGSCFIVLFDVVGERFVIGLNELTHWPRRLLLTHVACN